MPYPFEMGAIMANRYRLEALLGEGGMGQVWAATHLVTGKEVALKFLRPEIARDAGIRMRFLREARAACAVRHPNVVQIHDVLEIDGGLPMMVMDRLHGRSLGDLLAERPKLPANEFVSLLIPVVSAVRSAHQSGIVHRDLKPDNIFLAEGAEGSIDVKVLDFGIAKLKDSELEAPQSNLTATGAMLGTPYYMSPEQAFGEKDVDHRSDIWSLGIIFYECLSGAKPTEADNLGQILKVITTDAIRPLREVVPEISPLLSDVTSRMLQRDRERRPQDLRWVLAALEAHAQGRTSLAPDAMGGSLPPSAPTTERGPYATPNDRATTADGTIVPAGLPSPARARTALGLGVGALLLVAAGFGATRLHGGADAGRPSPPGAEPNALAASPPSTEPAIPSSIPQPEPPAATLEEPDAGAPPKRLSLRPAQSPAASVRPTASIAPPDPAPKAPGGIATAAPF